MKYYVYKNEVKDGPFSKEELELVMIYPGTLIWKEGAEDWQEARLLPELESIINPEPPPIPKGQIGYDRVEDIAGVNYKIAAIITAIYVGLNVLFIEKTYTTVWGIIISLVFPFIIWRYFKKFFKQLRDATTARFVNWIFVAYALFWPTLFFIMAQDWAVIVGRSGAEVILGMIFEGIDPNYNPSTRHSEELLAMIYILIFLMIAIVICIWVTGIKIIRVNNNYLFPLKRIAISTMICIPLYMFSLITYVIVNEPPQLIPNLLFMLPYIFLAIHFYRADSEDATA